MDRLEELKSKYRPAFDALQQNGAQVTQTSLQGNKLFIQGYVPSQQAKNAVWDQIKSVDATYSDLTCDLKVGAPEASSAELAQSSPQSLAGGLAGAFRNDQAGFPSMLSSLFSNSDGQQRAGLLNQLLGAAGPGLLGGALSGPLAGILKGGSQVTPQQAEQIPPEAVQQLAEHAHKNDPSIVDHVSSFYSQHPKVVQALGAGALALVMSHMRKQ